jgi:hypothetical protein
MTDPKDKIALLAIAATFIVSLINLIYTIVNNRKTTFVNTVTASRLRWIDSLRDKVASFIAVTVQILNPGLVSGEQQDMRLLLRERDTLTHQIVLHLNPADAEDQAIRKSVDFVVELTHGGAYTAELQKLLVDLRDATQAYLKKEWTRVKRESRSGEKR